MFTLEQYCSHLSKSIFLKIKLVLATLDNLVKKRREMEREREMDRERERKKERGREKERAGDRERDRVKGKGREREGKGERVPGRDREEIMNKRREKREHLSEIESER